MHAFAAILAFFLLAGIIAAVICFLLTAQKALERCSPQSRTTPPNHVWLTLIPFFNFVYQFFLVGHLGRSLGNEFARRGIAGADAQPGRAIGLAACVLGVVAIVPIPVLSPLLMIASVVFRIIYWVKIADYSRQIAEPFVAGSTEPPLFTAVGRVD
jgi:hypothetical protein